MYLGFSFCIVALAIIYCFALSNNVANFSILFAIFSLLAMV